MRGIANIVSLLVLTLLWGGEAFPRNRGFPIASVKSYVVRKPFLVLRGGGDIALEVDEDSDEIEDLDDEDNEEEDEVDEEEEEELDPVLTKSTLKSRTKVHAKKATETKQAVSAKLKTKTKKRGGGLLKVLRVPYIIRACLNPVTLFTMVSSFFQHCPGYENYYLVNLRLNPVSRQGHTSHHYST
jgi:hypothetical protein